jgi:hypothetical protein
MLPPFRDSLFDDRADKPKQNDATFISGIGPERRFRNFRFSVAIGVEAEPGTNLMGTRRGKAMRLVSPFD